MNISCNLSFIINIAFIIPNEVISSTNRIINEYLRAASVVRIMPCLNKARPDSCREEGILRLTRCKDDEWREVVPRSISPIVPRLFTNTFHYKTSQILRIVYDLYQIEMINFHSLMQQDIRLDSF
ncbi:hypothetical protein V1477_012054 [Vespula maculifrons]|uniref:Uncharacterized protein n=1 Tax=Vespula maculifrons TaxID=7453 RepID=A0ABD2C0Z7_VESMC